MGALQLPFISLRRCGGCVGQLVLPTSLTLLYWYKSTNTDRAETAVVLACGGAAGAQDIPTSNFLALLVALRVQKVQMLTEVRVQGEGLYWADSAVRTPNPEFQDAALRDSIWRQASQLLGLPP